MAFTLKDFDEAIRTLNNFCEDTEKSFDEIDAKGPLFANQNELLDDEKDFALDVFQRFIIDTDTEKHGLEFLSDRGQNLAFYADSFSFVEFQPTESRKLTFSDILKRTHDENYFKGYGDSNVLPPKLLDPGKKWLAWLDGEAKPESYDLAFVLNEIHRVKWSKVVGIFKGCGKILKKSGLLFTYGPFFDDYEVPQEEVVVFDDFMRDTRPYLGLRNITSELVPLAEANGLSLIAKEVSPDGLNKFLVWRKSEKQQS